MTLLELLASMVSRGVGRPRPPGPKEGVDRQRLEAGAVVDGRYRLTRLLGEGGMGAVWAAWHLRMRKEVAIKVIRADKADDDDLRRRFLREARAACMVRHPNIVEVHDVLDLEGGAPAIVMELLEGQSLRQLLNRERRLDVADAARILAPVADALTTAHAAGVVHRDLKPDNIFLARSPEGRIVSKVLDFGIAKLTPVHGEASSTSARTETGTLLGTPFYMAPEQIFGERDVDAGADVWALGIILYECLAGLRPTEADSLGQVFKRIVTDGIVPLREALPDLPSDLALLTDRMLVRDRRLRLASLSEVSAILSSYAGPARAGSIPDDGRARPREDAKLPSHAALLTQPSMAATVQWSDLRSAPRARRIALASAPAAGLVALLAWVGAHRGTETPSALATSPPPAETAPGLSQTPAIASPMFSGPSPEPPQSRGPGARAEGAPVPPISRPPLVHAMGSGGKRAIAPPAAPAPSNDAGTSPEDPSKRTNPGGVIEQPPF
jgi:serine/threonine-protein kinase